MKRIIYIALFTFLGIILQFMAHALIEIWYIGLLLADFPKYGFGLSWQAWFNIHAVSTVLFLLVGTWIGRKEGIYWWRKIYEENMIAKWKEKKIPISWLIVSFILLFIASAYWYYVDDVKPYLDKQRYQFADDLKIAPENYWKTYRNEKYGFEFKYPDSWYDSGGMRGDNQYLICLNPNGLSGDCFVLVTINVNTTLEEWIDRWKKFAEQAGKTFEEAQFNIGEVAGRRFGDSVFVEHNGYVYHFTKTGPLVPEFNQILSTFKFLK